MKNSSLPMYVQIANEIKAKIKSNEYPKDYKLPSEPELMQEFSVSRITIRKAIGELVQEGYLIKIQGKGTFVKNVLIRRKITHSAVLGFTKSVEENGFTSSSQLITREVVIANEIVGKVLEAEKEKVIYTKRIRFADMAPIMLENNYFIYEKYQGLLQEDLSGSLYQLLKNKYGLVEIMSDKTTLEMALATSEQAKLLEVTVGTPLFLMKTLIVDQNKLPVHYGEQYIVGEKYQFNI